MVAKILKDVIKQAETWPQRDQEELAEYAREIQARRTGAYTMSEEERAAAPGISSGRSWGIHAG
jgi:hypothetical protein